MPVFDEQKQFEFLILEGAQAGLSWSTILNKREGYRKAFANFDIEKVARFGKRDVTRLMNDAGIVRNRLKIESAIVNAQVLLDFKDKHGDFVEHLWSFVDGKPIVPKRKQSGDVPATTPESDRLSKI